jgi:hypothetical protein
MSWAVYSLFLEGRRGFRWTDALFKMSLSGRYPPGIRGYGTRSDPWARDPKTDSGGLGQQLAGCEAANCALPTSGRLSVTSQRRPSRQRFVFRHNENPARACDVRVPTAGAKRGFFYDAAFTHTMMSLRHALLEIPDH